MSHLLSTLRKHRDLTTTLMLLAVTSYSTLGFADTVYKTNSNVGFLDAAGTNSVATYAEFAAPTAADIIAFNNFITAASTYRVSGTSTSTLSVAGLQITDVSGGAITIQNNAQANNVGTTQTLSIGASGIDMSTAAQDLTFSSDTSGTTPAGTLTLNLSAAQTWSVGQFRNLTVNVAVTGGQALTVTGAGQTSFAADNGPAGLGALTVTAGQVNVDRTAINQNKLNDTAALTLNRGTINLQGGTFTGETLAQRTETVGSVTIGQGLSSITRTSGQGILQMNAITNSTGGMLNFSSAGIATTDRLNVNGILGGWAVINGNDWAINATNGADGLVNAIASYTAKGGAWGAAGLNTTNNINITSNATGVPTDTINSLRLNGAFSVTQNAGTTLNIATGGILKNSNTASVIGNATVGNSTITAGGAADGTPDQLYIWQGAGTAGIVINSIIANNGADVVSLSKAGSGTLILQSNSTYTGGTTIAEGPVELGANSAVSLNASLGTGAVVNHGALRINKNAASSLNNSISGTGSLANIRGQAVTLGGTNTYSGDTLLNIASSSFVGGIAGAFSQNSKVQMNATSTLTLGGFDQSVAGLDSNNNGATVALGANTLTMTGNSNVGNLSFQGVITGVGGSLSKGGTNTVTLNGTGALSYTGTTTVTGGTLQTDKVMSTSGLVLNGGRFISNIASSIPATATANLSGLGGSWQINNGFDQSIGALSGVAGTNITLMSGASNTTLTVTDNGGSPSTFAGSIIMGGSTGAGVGNFTKAGSNTLILSGGSSYSGTTTVNGGILRLGASSVLPDRTPLVLSNVAGVAFDLNGNIDTIGSLAGGGALGGNVTLGTTGQLTVGSNNTNTSFGGIISGGTVGTDSLVKTGTGTLTLTGGNTFTGNVLILGGSLTLNNAGGASLSATTGIRNAGLGSVLATTLSSENVGPVTGAKNTILSLASGTTLASTYTNVALAATGTTVDGNNTIRVLKDFPTTNLAPGMSIAGAGVPTGAVVLQILDGTNVLINANPAAAFTDSAVTPTSQGVLGSVITGAGGFTKSGPDGLFLTGNSNHSGATTINNGTLWIGGGLWDGARFSYQDVLSDDSRVVFAATGTQNLNFALNTTNLSPFERIASLSGGAGLTSTVMLSNTLTANGPTNTQGVLAVGRDNSSTTFNGRIIGGTATWLIKEGTGTFTWNNAGAVNDAFDGIFLVDQGGVALTGATGLDDVQNIYLQNNTTTFSNSVNDQFSVLQGGGRGAGKTLTGAVTNVGAVAGNYVVGGAATLSIATGTTLTSSTTTNSVFGGTIAGLGGFTKAGTSTLELRGANTYTGVTTVSAGTLRLGAYSGSGGVGAAGAGGFGTLAAGTGITMTGGTLDLSGTTQTVAGLVGSNTGGVIAIGSGNVTFASQGTPGANVVTTLTSNLNGVLNINGAGNVTLTGNNSGFGGMINLGSGITLTSNRAGGALNSTAGNLTRLNLGSGSTLVVTLADTIGSLSGAGNVTLTQGLTVNLGGYTSSSAIHTGSFNAGAGVLTINDGSLRLGGATTNNLYTGGTTLNRAALVLDYGAGATNIIPNTGVLTLNGSAIFVAGNVVNTDNAASTTLLANGGASLVSTFGTGGSTALLNLAAITRNTGTTLQISGTAAATSTANVSGILGGYAVYGSGFLPTDWAVANGATTPINGLAPASYTANTWGAGVHTDVTTGIAAATGATQTVRFNTSLGTTVTLSGAATVASGGILVTDTVALFTSTITNGGNAANTLTSGNGTDLILHQYNSRGTLVVDAVIAGTIGLTKAGPGTVILSRDNTFSGAGTVNIGGGRLQLGNGGTTGNLGVVTGLINNNGVLAVNRTNALTFGNIIQGNGWLIQEGAGGTLTLGGANTYTGRTSIKAGTIITTTAGALGTVGGITSVDAAGQLDIGNGTLPATATVNETIVLDGGTLRDNTPVANQTTLTSLLALLGPNNTVSVVTATDELRILSQVLGLADASTAVGIQAAGLVIGGTGIVTLENAANQWFSTTINNGATLQIGRNTAGTLGGRSDVLNNGTLILSSNDAHYVIGNTISGSGILNVRRNNAYITGNNTHTGGTVVGATVTGAVTDGVTLRLGNDGYTGSVGTGVLTLQAAPDASVNVRTHRNDDIVIPNITLNANSTGTARSATFIRMGLGNVDITGNLTIGPTNVAPGTQRAILQTEAGGKLVFSGTLVNGGANNLLNIVNNNIVVLGGSASNTYNGILSGNNVWVFSNSGTTTLAGANTFSTGNSYLHRGTLVLTGGTAMNDDNDLHVLRGTTLVVNNTETVGDIYSQVGAVVNVASGQTLTVDDNVTGAFFGRLTGAGNFSLGEYRAMGYNTDPGAANTLGGVFTLGTGTTAGSIQTRSLANVFGSASTINLGALANTGAANIEYIGPGETFVKPMNLSGSTAAVRITANGNGPLVLNGNMAITSTGNKTLTLSGQNNMGSSAQANTINGAITEAASVLTLNVNPSTGNNDNFGASRWRLTNSANDFSGNISVALGSLELNGDLGTGGGATSVMGDLTATRIINLGTNNFDGRRYDIFSGGDNLGAAGGLSSTGTLIFNDPNAGTATIGNNIDFSIPFSSTDGPGNGELVNNGQKVIVLQGDFSVGANGGRNWILDGTNTGTNTIEGVISDTTNTGNDVGILKEGPGTWRITNAGNTFQGNVTIARGTFEVSGGTAMNTDTLVNLTNAGSDGVSSGATFRLMQSETFGGIAGAIGTTVQLDAGVIATLNGASQTYSGVIQGAGGIERTSTDTNVRVSTLPNLNTFTGTTTITSGALTGNNSIANRIDVYYLANGGQPSGIGSSSSAASNLTLNTGVGLGGLRWIGFANQSTDRLFTLGVGTGAGSLWADGQVVGNSTPTISYTNTGSLGILNSGNRTLTLRGGNKGENIFAPQIVNDGANATSLQKLEQGTWVVTNSNTHTGATTINGGTLAITNNNALGTGAAGVTITLPGDSQVSYLDLRGVTVTGKPITMTGGNNNTNFGLAATTGTNVWTGAIAHNQTAIYHTAAGASLQLSGNIAGNIAGDLTRTDAFTKTGNGTLTLSGTNTLRGAFLARGGTVVLDYSTNNTSKLNDGNTAADSVTTGNLTLGAGTGIGFFRMPGMVLRGQEPLLAGAGTTLILSGGTHEEAVGSTTIDSGANAIQRTSGTATLRMAAITRSVGSTLDFGAINLATTDTLNAANLGILGGYSTIAKTDWATSTSLSNASTAWDSSTDRFTLAGLTNGQQVKLTTGIPAGLSANTTYFVVNATGTDFQISATSGGAAIDLTDSGPNATVIQPKGIVALAPGSYVANTWDVNALPPNQGLHTDVTASFSNSVATTGSVRFNTPVAATVTLTLPSTITSGGILITPNVGANNTGITGSTLTASTAAPFNDLVVHQHSTGLFTLDSQVIGTIGLTKSGTGAMLLTQDNTNTGTTSINEGLLLVGNGGVTGQLGTGAGAIILNGGLVFNTTHATQFTQSGTIRGNGSITLDAVNTRTILFTADNTSFTGPITVNGGTLAGSGNAAAFGSTRNIVTVNNSAVLDVRGISTGVSVFLNNTSKLMASTGSGTISGTVNIGGAGVTIETAAGATLTLSNLVYTTTGLVKNGDGVLALNANQMQNALLGQTALTTNPALVGQILVNAGDLNIGNARALGATGPGNETIGAPGTAINLRGIQFNYGDDPDPNREIFRVSGVGNGVGGLLNSTGTSIVTAIQMAGDLTIGTGGQQDGAAFRMDPYDINAITGSALPGASTLVSPTLTSFGGTFNLTKVGSGDMDLRDATITNVGNIVVREGRFRWLRNTPQNIGTGILSSAQIAGIEIGYGGATVSDYDNLASPLNANVGARFDLFRNIDLHHTVPITMNGVLAATNNGHNYLEVNGDTLPIRTFLDGNITLSGNAIRNIIHVEASGGTNTVVEQGNTTGQVQGKLIVGGQIVGSGGFTKTGFRELRLTNNNTFTGDLNVLRFGNTNVPPQSSNVVSNGVSFPTFGNAESWGEWGLTLNGPNGSISGASNVQLQRRGMITLDNTDRLDATSSVTGGNNNDRINNSANILFNHGWLRINGGSVNNTEALATTGGAKVQAQSGTNYIDLYPTDGAGTNMTLTIGEVTRSAGAILQFRNMDSTSTFSTVATGESVRVALNTLGTLTETGSGASTTSRKIVTGLLGGTIPHTLGEDLRQLGLNNGNASDFLGQQRNQQFLTGSHFMTYDGGFLRPLDDSEYFQLSDGLINITNGSAGQNVVINDPFTIVNQNTSINSLRIGPVADNNGSGGAINSGTTLTDYNQAHSVQLYVDGTLSIASGMISSAYFTVGNTSSASTLTIGGNLDFGTREAIINNQNGFINLTNATVQGANFEIRSNILGSGGLTKTGFQQVVLDGMNTYSGVTTISDGVLFLRNGRTALGVGGAGNGVVIVGNGNLNSGNGIQVGSATAREDVYVGVLQGDQQILRTDNDLTSWFANIIVDNVDVAGQPLFTPRIRTDNSATSIINGNIYGGPTAVTNDIIAVDSRLVQFDTAGNNVFIIRGQFGDRGDASGNALPIPDPISSLPTLAGTRTNENEVLRVNLIGGSADSVFILERQHNAAGRISFGRGTHLISYDPAASGNDGVGFYTNAAISRIPNADSSSTTFTLNGGTTQQGMIFNPADSDSGFANSLFLTRAGQTLNMATWSTSGGGGTGSSKTVGGLNQTGSVNFGIGTGTLNIAGNLQLYAASGGTVVMNQRLVGGNVIKSGRGQVTLLGSTAGASDSSLELNGGTLFLDYTGQNNARIGSGTTVFNGGVLRMNPFPTGGSTLGLGSTVARFNSGTSEIIAEAQNGQTTTINIGNTTAGGAAITRAVGGSANFVETIDGSGTPVINMLVSDSTTAVFRNRAIPWGTYSTTPRQAVDFAMSDAGNNNDVRIFGRPVDEFVNNVAAWQKGMDVSENGAAGFFGTLASSQTLNTIRFDAGADSTVDIGAGQTLALKGDGVAGGILVSSNVGLANKTIAGGSLSAFSITTSGISTTNGSAVISGFTAGALADYTPGMIVSGRGIPNGSFIRSVDLAAGTITLSANATASTTVGNEITVASVTPDVVVHQYGQGKITLNTQIGGTIAPVTITGVITADGSTNAAVADTSTLSVGMGLLGNNIPYGTYIAEIVDATNFRMSQSATGTNATIMVGNGTSLTIAGPSTTGDTQFGSTGEVVLAPLANNYIGRTTIGGAILSFSNPASLGFNPAVAISDYIAMNGGTLKYTGTGFADLQNRGFLFEGNGGVIEVVDASAELRISDNISSQNAYRGDLIKMGPGTLALAGNGGNNASFRGLIDVRQGTLRLTDDSTGAAGTTTILGSNNSYGNGTIIRNGATLAIQMGNGNNTGDWTFEEWFIFEGGAQVQVGSLNAPSSNLSATFPVNPGNARPVNLHGVIDIRGTTTFDTAPGQVLRFNNGTGYLTGGGDIIKDGQGQMEFRGNTPDWTGGLVIKQGTVYALNQADVLGTGYLPAHNKTITLGDSARQGEARLFIQNPDNIQNWIFEINHNINVVYNPAQAKTLGIDNIANGNLVSYNGNITLNDNLILRVQDTVISTGGEQAYLNFNGAFADGAATSGNLTIQTNDSDGTANNLTNGRTYGYAVFNGNNSAWTGDVTISTNTAYNQDNTAILRLGHAQALTAANDVTMNFNSILQVGGGAKAIGSLTTTGGTGPFNGDAGTMSASTNGSSEIIENAASTAGTLTIAQSTPAAFEALWDAKFRDGTLNSQFSAPGANVAQPSSSLSLVKSGAGWATLTLDNDYTGTTTVSQGILQVGRAGIGDTGALNAGGTTVLSGAALAGTGMVNGTSVINSGATLRPGDLAGSAQGTLTFVGDVTLAAGSSTLLQVTRPSYNNTAYVGFAAGASYDAWIAAIPTDTYSTALTDPVLGTQHDKVNVLGTLTWATGTTVSLVNNGYTPAAGDVFNLFDWFNITGGINVGPAIRVGTEGGTDLGLFELGGDLRWDTSLFNTQGILVVVPAAGVVPEPGRAALLLLGLLAALFRRTRRR